MGALIVRNSTTIFVRNIGTETHGPKLCWHCCRRCGINIVNITAPSSPFRFKYSDGEDDVQRHDYSYLWLVGNGRMVVMVLIIVPIPPFPTNQRQVFFLRFGVFCSFSPAVGVQGLPPKRTYHSKDLCKDIKTRIHKGSQKR